MLETQHTLYLRTGCQRFFKRFAFFFIIILNIRTSRKILHFYILNFRFFKILSTRRAALFFILALAG